MLTTEEFFRYGTHLYSYFKNIGNSNLREFSMTDKCIMFIINNHAVVNFLFIDKVNVYVTKYSNYSHFSLTIKRR